MSQSAVTMLKQTQRLQKSKKAKRKEIEAEVEDVEDEGECNGLDINTKRHGCYRLPSTIRVQCTLIRVWHVMSSFELSRNFRMRNYFTTSFRIALNAPSEVETSYTMY